MRSEMYYKKGFTYVKVCDNLKCKERKIKGHLLNLCDLPKLNRVREELRKELNSGK